MKSVGNIFKGAVGFLTALAGVTGLTACQDDFDIPPVDVPQATMVANTTIAELKETFWDDATNYATLVPYKDEATQENYVIKGRVISSDASGNIYKSLVIQDETGALPMSINQNSLYNTYRVGQEVYVNVTGIYIGKYAGYQQLGGYGEYNGTPQTSFMAYETFEQHAELNGLPEPQTSFIQMDATRPVEGIYGVIADLGTLPSDAAGLRNWQGRLVELRNVHFQDAGSTYAAESDYNSSTTSRTLLDASGNSITVRNSGYASFAKDVMPSGSGTVRGILSYYNGTWQILIRSTADVIFDSKGNQDDPYTIPEAIELQGTGAAGWTQGYIVGSVKAGVSTITSNEDIIWGSDADLDNTLVIGATADTKTIANSIVVALPQGSALREFGNLVDNPAVYGKQITIYGTFDNYMGTYGLTNNTGSSTEFVIDGVSTSGGTSSAVASLYCDFENYDTKIANLVAAGWTIANTSGGKDWYLYSYSGNVDARVTAYKGSGSGPWQEWLVSPAINLSESPQKTLSFTCQAGYNAGSSTFQVYVLTSNDVETANKTLLDAAIPEIPSSGFSAWTEVTVDLSQFSGVVYIGWYYEAASSTTSSTYCIDNVNIGGASTGNTGGDDQGGTVTGAGSEDEPYSVAYVQSSTTDESGVWVEGYIVGFINGTKWTGATFSNDMTGVAEDASSGYNNTNLVLGSSASVTSTANAIPCKIPYSATNNLREVLGLRANPEMYLKHVKLKGDIGAGFGTRCLSNIVDYSIID
jgi:hypothetical protein